MHVRLRRLTAVAAVPPDFTDTVAIGGLTQPTATVFADLRPQVYDFWDRGLLGLAVDPQFPADPYVYALYTYDALQWNDACPNPPGATSDGCLAYGRLSRLTMGAGGVATGEQVLITDWCQQYPSHSIGTVTFGPDGALYLGGGDGASFNSTDYGQVGNPCGDPPSPAGVNLAPPDARGGALRSQSPRRPAGEPTTLDGTILRYDPDTGDRRIIAYGLRSPTNCHAHVVQDFVGVASGSFTAPDHEYPSYLDLTLTARDSDGNTASTTRRLDPRTVVLTFTSSPSGALLVVGGTATTTPFTRTVIVGSVNSISAQFLGPRNRRYEFRTWSDGGAQTHNITAPSRVATYQASYKQSRG